MFEAPRWFQIFFIFTPTWGNDPIRLIFFRWVETTNQAPLSKLWKLGGMLAWWNPGDQQGALKRERKVTRHLAFLIRFKQKPTWPMAKRLQLFWITYVVWKISPSNFFSGSRTRSWDFGGVHNLGERFWRFFGVSVVDCECDLIFLIQMWADLRNPPKGTLIFWNFTNVTY